MNDDTMPIRIPGRPSASGTFTAVRELVGRVDADLKAWQARGSDDEPAAAAAMGRAIQNAKTLIDLAKELHTHLVLEDSISVVEFDREAYQIRKSGPGVSI